MKSLFAAFVVFGLAVSAQAETSDGSWKILSYRCSNGDRLDFPITLELKDGKGTIPQTKAQVTINDQSATVTATHADGTTTNKFFSVYVGATKLTLVAASPGSDFCPAGEAAIMSFTRVKQ